MKRIKLLSIVLAGTLACSLLSGCSMGSVKEPTFEETEGVVFAAYAAPTVKGRVSDLEELDDAYKKLAEAGFTKAIALYEGCSYEEGKDAFETIKLRSEEAEKVAMTVLDIAEKYGVKYWVRDWSFYGLGRLYANDLTTKEDFEKVISEMFSEENPYIDHPAYGGNFGFDEPQSEFEMQGIAWQAELYNKYIQQNSETGGEIFVNLLPSYGSQTYAEDVKYYFENVAPYVGYVSWDYYPFVASGTENYIRETYYYNLELMANMCKEYDYEMRCFVQAKSDFTGMRAMENIGDIRFQIYSGMAFGVREFSYYTYSSAVNETNPTSEDGYSLYDYTTGTYTWVYEAAKEVHAEVHEMDDAYMAYDWEGIMYRNANEMIDNPLFLNFASPMEEHERMEFVTNTQDVMAGVFKAKDADREEQDAFMFVNVTDPSQELENEVTVKFEKARALLMYRLGEKEIVELDSDGTYTFLLQPGEGRFVIPLK